MKAHLSPDSSRVYRLLSFYGLGSLPRRVDEQRRALEREALAQFECPVCGEDEPPFLDLFSLDHEIECESCIYKGPLKDFLP